MMACPDCHRVRTPTGLHICLKSAMAKSASIRTASHRGTVGVGDPPSKRQDMRRLGTIRLPGNDVVANIWNAVIEGKA